MGEYESDVDIEGYEEDDDGKPKTPAPVIVFKSKTLYPGVFNMGTSVPLFPPIIDWFNELIIAYKMKIRIKQ